MEGLEAGLGSKNKPYKKLAFINGIWYKHAMDGVFDTHLSVKRLRERGIPEEQAEAFVQVIADARESGLNVAATKADLRELELKLENRFKEVQLHIGSMIVALGGILVAIRYFG